jgi:hypothetical protein
LGLRLEKYFKGKGQTLKIVLAILDHPCYNVFMNLGNNPKLRRLESGGLNALRTNKRD